MRNPKLQSLGNVECMVPAMFAGKGRICCGLGKARRKDGEAASQGKRLSVDLTQHLGNEEDDLEPLLHYVETLQRNDTDELSGSLTKLKLNPEENRFFGKSSAIRLVQTALDFQSRFAGVRLTQITHPVCGPPQWLLPVNPEAPQYIFPDSDLLPVLVNLYFNEQNCLFPVLHRPTFDRKVADGLHLVDFKFAATLLMVCSLGARHSDDSRVVLEGQTGRQSAGWKWYSQVRDAFLDLENGLTYQVRVIPEHLIYKPDLYELQTIALSALYLMALLPTPMSWNHIGFGLRRAQDVGAHRHKTQPCPTAENEQWKRVFWVLLCLDWLSGTLVGRPLAIHNQDFDQELPLECDDEYWGLPEPYNFKQPTDKPSVIAPLESSPPGPIPSLAICTNAARSCARIFEVHDKRGIPLNSNNLPVAFTAGVVLLLNSWCSKRSGFPYYQPKELDVVFKCLKLMTEAETSDILIRLIQAGDGIHLLFQDIKQVPSAPPSAQAGHGLSVPSLAQQRSDPESAVNWASAFTRNPMEEFETPHRVQSDNADTYPAEEGSGPVPRDTYTHPNAVYDFEQLMNMDLSSSSADMPVDPNAMLMWSTAPASFSVDDWSYIMAEDTAGLQFDHFASPNNEV
ncbi:fungal-specific transcription factor domain-containing protein [Mycena galericulata]|nr:fungal-specific transcription factor domain-containing protein [Mycena galericulata]